MSARLPLAAAVAALTAALDSPRLGTSADFAAKLCAEHGRRGLTEKQSDWVYRLLDRVNGAEAPPPAVGDVRPLLALFDRALAAGLRFPKIRLRAADGLPVVIGRAGERSKAPGSLTVTDGAGFESGRYFGRIDPGTGALTRGRDCTPAVVTALTELAQDPAARAAIHGHATGYCCFCARSLEDARSVGVGYGPVCAEKFGLPWGEVKAPPVVISAEVSA
jgi:hypothetical protein